GFIAFYTVFMNVGGRVSSLSQLIPSLLQAEVSFRRIDEILQHRHEDDDTASIRERKPLLELREGIGFEQVSFGYNPQEKPLDQVSFHIPAGKLTAFVGPSGSGKSTALQLLIRFYDPEHGVVTIDQTD